MEYFVNEFPETLNEPWCFFPHEFHLTSLEFESKEIRAWLNDNNVKWTEAPDILIDKKVILFSCEEDAMAFKLTWE